MTTGEFWILLWSLPWYKRIWFAMVDDVIVFLTVWPVWVLIIIMAFYPEISTGFKEGWKQGKKWVKDVTNKNI